ncbi:hypothetical protein [Deinococcus rubellus]|uniref:Lipoprotein n=1 Tax=Deinococcus rubellus TaxID=1889240 RepID=A0ABY5YKC0_9DEIO|nr:hypothetical protein [Deinococcus rubellus]UWX65549.1 hypothetical protein N0D28_07845 [Deinococcus rubellus]
MAWAVKLPPCPDRTLSAALLAGCGVVPLPAVGIPDQVLKLPSSVGFGQCVAYDGSDAFAGTSLPSLPGSGMRVCAASGESAQKIGTLTLKGGEVTGFQLSGVALDRAAKAGRGYFGVQALSGVSLLGDHLKLSGMKVSAKF